MAIVVVVFCASTGAAIDLKCHVSLHLCFYESIPFQPQLIFTSITRAQLKIISDSDTARPSRALLLSAIMSTENLE